MRVMHQVWLGILAAVVSGSIVMGGLLLALVEGGYQGVSAPTPGFNRPAAFFQRSKAATPVKNPTPTRSAATEIVVEAAAIQATPTPELSAPACNPPAGWSQYVVRAGDTLPGLARILGLPVNTLAEGNCLAPESVSLAEGSELYLPFRAPTATSVSCGPPPRWVIYRVQYGDTLYKIGSAVGATVYSLQQANCLGRSNKIYTGQPLFVPYIPVFYVPPTFTLPPTATSTAGIPTDTTNQTPSPTIIDPTDTPWPTLPPTTISPTDPPPVINPTDPPLPTEIPPTATSPSINPDPPTQPAAPPAPTVTPEQPSINP